MSRSKGIAMIHALVGALIIGIMAAALARLVMGRALFVHRERNTIQARAVAEAAYLKAAECLNRLNWVCTDPPVPPGDCTACGGACSGIFGSFDLALGGDPTPRRVNVELSASGGACAVKATCVSCL